MTASPTKPPPSAPFSSPPEGRAVTADDKRRVLDRIYRAWVRPEFETMRLGQLLIVAMFRTGNKRLDIFDIEDEAIANAVDKE